MALGLYAADGSMRASTGTGQGLYAPDGSRRITLTDGAGVNLTPML